TSPFAAREPAPRLSLQHISTNSIDALHQREGITMRMLCNSPLIAVVIAAGIGGTAHPTLGSETYQPVIDPANFSTEIDNPYFSLPTGRKMTYAAQTDSGLEQIEVSISGETRIIMGVRTLVYLDRAFV